MLTTLLLLGAMTTASSTATPASRQDDPRPHLSADLPPFRRASLRPGRRLEGSAPTILPGLVRHWLEAAAVQPSLKVDIPPPYDPPQGRLSPRLSAFLAGRLDFAFLTRALAASDTAAFRRSHGYDPLVIPVANGSWRSFGFVDPVVFIVNAANPVRALSFGQIDALFSRTRRRGFPPVRSWRDVGVAAEGDRRVHLVGGASWSSEDSARAVVVRERVLLGGEWRDDPEAAAGDTEADVPGRVARDPLAIGFTGLGHITPGTRAVAIRLSGRPVSPTFEAVRTGRYPLARTVDLLVARPPGTCLRPELLEFVRFLLSRDGQQAVLDTPPFLPLTGSQARSAWRRAAACVPKP